MRVSRAVLPALALIVFTTSASQAALVDTGFESDSLGATPAGWFGTIVATDAQANTGSQSAVVTGAGANGFAAAVDDRPAVASLAFSFYLDDDVAADGFGKFFHEQFAGGGLGVQIEFRTDLGVRTWTGAGAPSIVGGSVTVDAWHDVLIEFDYDNLIFDLTYDGVLIGDDLAMGAITTGEGPVEYRLGTPGGVDGVFFDDVKVSAVPEPASVALLAAGMLVLLRRRS